MKIDTALLALFAAAGSALPSTTDNAVELATDELADKVHFKAFRDSSCHHGLNEIGYGPDHGKCYKFPQGTWSISVDHFEPGCRRKYSTFLPSYQALDVYESGSINEHALTVVVFDRKDCTGPSASVAAADPADRRNCWDVNTRQGFQVFC